MYLLDSNAWIAVIRRRNTSVMQRMGKTVPAEIYLCSIVKTELLLGALKSANPSRNLAVVNAVVATYQSPTFDDKAAEHYASLRAELESKSTPIGPNDYFIAAIALANGLTVVTHNTREFSRISGLTVEDWQGP